MAGETADLQSSRPRRPLSPRARRARRVLLVAGSVLGAVVVWEGGTRIVAYTDDAYVRSDLVAVAPEVTGPITDVHVRDNQRVRRGDRLVSIDPTPFRLAVEAAQAALREAQAQLRADQEDAVAAADKVAGAAASLALAQVTQHRGSELEQESFASRQQLDVEDARLRQAEADVQAARAGMAHAQEVLARDEASIARATAELGTRQWALDRTEVLAPVDGTINNLTTRVGDTARAEVALIGIVDAHAWRVIANYKQDYIRRFAAGGTGWVWLDSAPWHLHRARIQGIGRAINRSTDAAGLLPYVAPTTDWIRLQRRFPVTLLLDDRPDDLPLYMGADARVVIFP
jgi:multidrug efflux system membrane fusion protein